MAPQFSLKICENSHKQFVKYHANKLSVHVH